MTPSTTNLINFEDHTKNKTEMEVSIKMIPDDVIIEEMKGSDDMSETKYATKEEIKHLETTTDLKLQNMSDNLANKIDHLNQKIDNIPNSIKLMLLEEREEQRKQKSETTKFLVGTIVLGGLGLIVSLISLFL